MRKIEKLIYKNERGNQVEFSTRSIYHTNEVTGLNDIRNTIYSYNSMGQDGDSFISSRIEAREIEIVGDINERNKDKMIEYRRKLTKILNPQLKATLIYEYGDFTRVIDCRVDNAPIFNRKKLFENFTVQLICLDPFWRDINETRDDIATWTGNLEFGELELSDDGLELGYREPSVIVNVTNNGDVKAGIRVLFRATGSVTNPEVLNIDTGEFIRINTTLEAGDELTLTTYYGKKQVSLKRSGIVSDAYRYLDIESTYIQLNLGDNLFRYTAESNADNLEVSIYHDNRYLGV